ncbi:hypothetical protein FZZ93_15805 [Halomonas eurihalina]|uniref:Uncharacterized protein n=1 Tax=Halomonas eurihalina TaxID=42566 RepID=A0A5D9CNS8_HALER|nr:hypothetical protein FZZ93_15805 [Halomonas eurihalina]
MHLSPGKHTLHTGLLKKHLTYQKTQTLKTHNISFQSFIDTPTGQI